MTSPAFLTELQVVLVDDAAAEGRGTWRLMAPLVYRSAVAGSDITVPPGFVTDFESVPRVPGIFTWLGDRFSRIAAVHDWLYTCHSVEREVADAVLREGVLLTGGSLIEAEAIYHGVRAFGAAHWSES